MANFMRKFALAVLLPTLLWSCSSGEPSLSLHWRDWAGQQADIWLADAQAMQIDAAAYCSAAGEIEEVQSSFTELLGQWAYINGYPYKAIDEQGLSFSLYFWPDKRNVTEIRLSSRIESARGQPNQGIEPSQYDQFIAAEKGIPALEWLLYKEGLSRADRCTALIAVSEIYLSDVSELHSDQLINKLVLEQWTESSEVIAGRSIALNLLYSQVSRLESHLRQSRDEQGLWISYMAEGWRSENTWMVYRQSLTSLKEMLVHTGQTSTISSANKTRLNSNIDEAEAILEKIGLLDGQQQDPLVLDQLHQLLLELTNFLETDLAENFGILIGFNNFDGD